MVPLREYIWNRTTFVRQKRGLVIFLEPTRPCITPLPDPILGDVIYVTQYQYQLDKDVCKVISPHRGANLHSQMYH